MWPGSPNIPRRTRTKKKLVVWKEEEEEEQQQQAVRRDRRDRKQWLLLSFSLSFQELCSYIILPWYLMSQSSSAWHSRLARQPLLHRGGTLTHTPSQVISTAVRLWCKGARHIQKHFYCMSGKKKRKKRSRDGLSVSVCHFWACHFSTCCKFVRRTECCWWIWGWTQRALSESLVITGASLFMTANKIALFVAFLWLHAKMYLFSRSILSDSTQVSAMQEVPCSAMIVLSGCVKKKVLPLQQRPPTNVWVGDQQSGGRPISCKYRRGNIVKVGGQIQIKHDDRLKKKWRWEDHFKMWEDWQAG